MEGNTHSLIGIVAGMQLGQVWHVDPLQVALIAGAAALGALAPDIDIPMSAVGRRLWLISKPLSLLVQHRGPTHSLIALCAVAFVGTYYDVHLGLAFAAGYATHLVADMTTKSGVLLFWPVDVKCYALPRPLRLRTGNRAERLIGAALALFVLWSVWEMVQ